MVIKSCFHCGSSKFIADRSLAGRIVCAQCGTPFIKGNFKSSTYSFRGLKQYSNGNWKVAFIAILLFSFLIVIFI